MQNIAISNTITAQVEAPHFMVSLFVIIAILAVAIWLSIPRRSR